METQHLMDTYKYFHKESGIQCVNHHIMFLIAMMFLIAVMQRWYVESLDMKEQLPLTEDQEIMNITIYYGLIFIAVEMKTLYMIVASVVVNFMKAIIVVMYLDMHVKVSLNTQVAKISGLHLGNDSRGGQNKVL